MNNLKNRTIELYEKGFRPCEIAKMLEAELNESNLYNKIRGYIRTYTGKRRKTEVYIEPGYGRESMIHDQEPAKQLTILQNQEPEHFSQKWDGLKVIRFGLISDTHFSSKYTQTSYLHDFYDFCKREGITAIYHAGDITDGLKMRAGHEFELYEHSADGQVADVIRNYPRRDGITTYFITGNHDASLYKHVGYDIGPAIARDRDDMVYLGRDCAVVNLTPNCTLELRHPWDGTAYALSYKIQKMIESMESDSKPNILAVGHYHKQGHFMHRNVHGILVPCFEAQTPFTRGKGISTVLGGYIITLHVDENGTIQRMIPEFVPYYKSIKDDYKNYKH